MPRRYVTRVPPFVPFAVVMVFVVLALVGPPKAFAEAAPADVPALIDAVRNQDVEAVSTLLREGAAVDERQPDGATALHWSVHRDDLEIADMLLRAGADVNAVNRLGASPLWLASMNGNAQLVERLLQAGANPNVALPEGETPLMTASRTGTLEGVQLLIEAGADLDARESTREQTALMWAVAQGHHDVVRQLVEAGADVTARSKVRPRLMYAARSNGAVFEQGVVENLGGFTPLLFASRLGDIESARMLLGAGADLDDAAANGASLLVTAVHSGHTALANFLLDAGADPNAAGAGYTALHAAVLRGDLEATQALLAHGADPNARLEKGTPVRRASEDWTLRPEYVSATPFWLAAVYREPEVMRVLADAGADPSLSTTERWVPVRERVGGVGPPRLVGGFVTPVMAAVRGASDRARFYVIANPDPVGEERLALETVRVAAELGVDIAAVDETGTSALHDAAARNLKSIVQLLGERGAPLDVKNKAGRTPLDLARAGARRGRGLLGLGPDWASPNAVDLLLEFGATDPSEADR